MIAHAQAPQPTVQRRILRVPFLTTLKIHCGCGFSAQTIKEAEEHAESTQHTLHITGEIRTQR